MSEKEPLPWLHSMFLIFLFSVLMAVVVWFGLSAIENGILASSLAKEVAAAKIERDDAQYQLQHIRQQMAIAEASRK